MDKAQQELIDAIRDLIACANTSVLVVNLPTRKKPGPALQREKKAAAKVLRLILGRKPTDEEVLNFVK